MVALLPARIDPIDKPWSPDYLRKRFLTVWSFSARGMIGTLRHRNRRDAFAIPDGPHADQVDVETGPAVIPQVEHDASRGEIIRRKTLPDFSGIEHGGEKWEIS